MIIFHKLTGAGGTLGAERSPLRTSERVLRMVGVQGQHSNLAEAVIVFVASNLWVSMLSARIVASHIILWRVNKERV